MAKHIIVEEFHVTLSALRGLPETEYNAIYRTLNNNRFQSELCQAVRTVCRQYPDLLKVRVRLTR